MRHHIWHLIPQGWMRHHECEALTWHHVWHHGDSGEPREEWLRTQVSSEMPGETCQGCGVMRTDGVLRTIRSALLVSPVLTIPLGLLEETRVNVVDRVIKE